MSDQWMNESARKLLKADRQH